MRSISFAFLMTWCVAFSVVAQTTAPTSAGAPDVRWLIADAQLQSTLDRNLPEIRFTDVGFADVIDFLRDTTNLPIFVNWKQLEKAGVDRNAPISLALKNVSLRSVLTSIVRSADTEKADLAWTADDAVVVISTSDDLFPMETRAISLASFATQPADATDKLIATLRQTVAPGTWDEPDGKGEKPVLRPLDNALIVRHRPAVIDQVEAIVATLDPDAKTRQSASVRWMVVDPDQLPADTRKALSRLLDAGESTPLTPAQVAHLDAATVPIEGLGSTPVPIRASRAEPATVIRERQTTYTRGYRVDEAFQDFRWQPVLDVASSGVSLTLTPLQRRPSERVLIADVKVSQLLELAENEVFVEPPKGKQAEPVAKLRTQYAVIARQTLKTEVAIQPGKTVAISAPWITDMKTAKSLPLLILVTPAQDPQK